MGYQVLARKYRPQRFADVAGQDHVTRTLMNALSQNRIAHGYIFSGHRGIGKTTVEQIEQFGLEHGVMVLVFSTGEVKSFHSTVKIPEILIVWAMMISVALPKIVEECFG